GGKGFHVLVPLDRRSTFDDTREFAEMVAGAIARAHPRLATPERTQAESRGCVAEMVAAAIARAPPRLATTEWTKARRRGVLVDSNQNGEGKTIASVYSVRPKAGAPVSTPLRWGEVGEA